MSEGPESERGILVNGSFRGQRVTGQQRYATEIAGRLLAHPRVRESPAPRSASASASAMRAWGRAQLISRGRRPGEWLLTLTSRGPLVAQRQAVVVHDLFVLEHPEWYSRGYSLTHQPVLRAQLHGADLIIAVSEPGAEALRERRPRTPVIVAPNAPADAFRLDPPGEIADPRLRDGGFVLAVASRDPRKNLERLVAAHARLPAALRRAHPLVLVGGSTGHFAGTAYDDGEAMRLGYVDDAELARLYASAGAVVFPSLDEGFGLPAVEALAAGAPLVVSDIPVLRWVSGDDAIYVEPLSIDAIAAGIAAALESPPSPEGRVRAAGRVRDRFDWGRSADRILQALTER